MRVLFDQGVPVPLRRALVNHQVATAHEMGWDQLQNGQLLAVADQQFDALVTTDQNLRYQQNLAGRRLAILVLPTTSWPILQQHGDMVASAIENLRAGDYCELNFPQVH